ncbi:tetratricopeptide repeat protein [Polystyrenella longa]|uniref:Tetratricopeptide repeat protein n=1 Tax=Polystyrenella longa TaxID=2528007 RepID=A0A518CIJ1_9PLAN|nr:tetratricopeptide repeat protein [Polystyrenella longa]QDU79056.1 tetratricopeptide repeat protein [Polystyrenella longa]
MKTLQTSLVLLATFLTVGCQSSPFNSFRSASWSQKDVAEKELMELTENAPQGTPKSAKPGPIAEHEQDSKKSSAVSDIQLASAEFPMESDTSLAKAATSDVDKLLREGQAYESAGDFDQAKQVYKQVLASQPVNSRAHHRLAVLADLQKNYTEAEQHYRQAMLDSPLDPELLSDLGYSYLLQNRYSESQSYLTQAVQMAPTHTRAVNNLGLLHAKQGQYDQALAMFRKTGTESEAQMKLSSIAPGYTAGNNQAVASNNSAPQNNSGVVNANAQVVSQAPVGMNPFTQFTPQASQNTQAIPTTQLNVNNTVPAAIPAQFGSNSSQQDFQTMAPVPQRQNLAVAPSTNGNAPTTNEANYNGPSANSQNANVMQSNYTAQPQPNGNATDQHQPHVFGAASSKEIVSAPISNGASNNANTLPNGARVPFVFGAESASTNNQQANQQPNQATAFNGNINQNSVTNQNQIPAGGSQNIAQANWSQGQGANAQLQSQPQYNGMINGQGVQPVNYNTANNGMANSGMVPNNSTDPGSVLPLNQMNSATSNALPSINPGTENQTGWGMSPATNGMPTVNGINTANGINNGTGNLQAQTQQYDAWGNPIPSNMLNNANQQQPQVFPSTQAMMPQNQVFNPSAGQYQNGAAAQNGQAYQYPQQSQPVITPGSNNRNAYSGQNETVRF